MTVSSSEVVALRGITKRFGSLVATRAANLSVAQSEVHALVGENGAGKSTLMNILYGVHQPTEGTIVIEGKEVQVSNPARAIALGVGMVHQHFKLVPSFTVAQNIILGAEPGQGMMLREGDANEQVAELSRRFDLELDPRVAVRDLPVGLQQRVEILKTLYRNANILILDEPTAVLTPQETRELFATMRRLAASGKSIIFITHKLKEVIAVSDRISVMRQGEIVQTLPNLGVTPETLATAMVGRSVILQVVKMPATPKGVALKVQNLDVQGDRGIKAVTGASFEVCRGEIVGIAGVQGNGQDELVAAIVGARKPLSGKIAINGRDVADADPLSVRKFGLAYVPADRARVGLCLQSPIWENLTLGHQNSASLGFGPLLSLNRALNRAATLITGFDVRGAQPGTLAGALSGGNQQKIVLARELDSQANLIVVDQPSQGVDIGAIESIHRTLVTMRDAGRGVLLVSADLDEIFSLSDRIVVMYRGEIVGQLETKDTNVEEVGRLMGGILPATPNLTHPENVGAAHGH